MNCRMQSRCRVAKPARNGDVMLPDFRFLFGALLATGMLGVAGFGLATAVRLSHEARVGPMEASRSLAFDERADWNQFSDPELARRFEQLARQSDEAGMRRISDPAATGGTLPPAVASSAALERNEPIANAAADTDTTVAMVEEKAADLPQEPSPESAASTAATAPAAQESVASAPAAEPADQPIVAADTNTPTTVEVTATPAAVEVAAAPAAVEVAVAPAPVEIAVAPATVEVIAEPVADERVANAAATVTDESAEIAQPATPPDAAQSEPQMRTPLPLPKPKQVAAKRTAKVKVAKAAKARPRAAAKQPAASTGYGVPNQSAPWSGDNFFR
jgi:hypothetical protein